MQQQQHLFHSINSLYLNINTMKQENSTTKTESKPPIVSHSSSTPSRIRASSSSSSSSKSKDFHKSAAEALLVKNPRAKSVPRELIINDVPKTRIRSSTVLSKPKSRDDDAGAVSVDNGRIVSGRSGCRVEQFSRPRRRSDLNFRRNEDDPDEKAKKKENKIKDDELQLQEKLSSSEVSINSLQSEVVSLKAELDKIQCLNVELQSQNKKLSDDLAAALAKIEALTTPKQRETIGEYQTPKFKDIQKLIAHKLEHPKVKKDASSEPTSRKSSLTAPLHPISVAVIAESIASAPPPPPPPPPRPPARATTARKAPALFEFYHSLTKREGKKDSPSPANLNKRVVISQHSSIVGEIENRSAHLLAIKADIETKGEFINGLIQKVLAAAYTDIEDVLKFADWLDNELSSLADERAVLKHFKWPERKADAMREAAIEYRDLKLLESEISSYKDDADLPCGSALKKMASLLDKSERSIQRLIKLRNSVMLSYQDYKIPTDWMLDSGIVRKIKQASMKLAKMYMNRVTMELKSVRNTERESAQEALLLQGVRFAYRAQQFAGGLDSETLCALEEIRQRVTGHVGGGSREVMAGIPSS